MVLCVVNPVNTTGIKTSYVLRLAQEKVQSCLMWTTHMMQIQHQNGLALSTIVNSFHYDPHPASVLEARRQNLGLLIMWEAMFALDHTKLNRQWFIDPSTYCVMLQTISSPAYSGAVKCIENNHPACGPNKFLKDFPFLSLHPQRNNIGYRVTTMSHAFRLSVSSTQNVDVVLLQKTFKKLSKNFQKTFKKLSEQVWHMPSEKLLEALDGK